MRILSCYQEDKDRSEKERRATHTSGFVVKDEGDHKIALYFSGRRHAGENLDHVLERRSPSLPMPIKMSDASAVNGKKMAQTIDANCLAHGRGKFKELEEIFPVECGQVNELFLTKTGKSFDGRGAPPDIRAPVFPKVDLENGRDSALEKALEALGKR